MIDALTAVIACLAGDEALAATTVGRIAAKHKFGMGPGGSLPNGGTAWPTPAKALQVNVAPAPAGQRWQTPRLECRCYGESQAEALKVYNALAAAAIASRRRVVATPDGNVLIYFLVMDSTPGAYQDPDTKVDFMLCYIKAAVSEEAV